MRCRNDIIRIICGDTVTVLFSFRAIDPSAIASFSFSSAEAELQKECPYSEEFEAYVLELTPEETEALEEMQTSYDITIKLTSGHIYTMAYENCLVVLPKTNQVNWEEQQ